jgi:hypothetical protein
VKTSAVYQLQAPSAVLARAAVLADLRYRKAVALIAGWPLLRTGSTATGSGACSSSGVSGCSVGGRRRVFAFSAPEAPGHPARQSTAPSTAQDFPEAGIPAN